MISDTLSHIETNERLLSATRYQLAASRRVLRQPFGFGIAGGSEGPDMQALPDPMPQAGQEQLSGLVCPDCSGNVVVRADNGHLAFQCRVGHEYSFKELLGSKEGHLESAAWRTIFAFEELAALLRDAEARGLLSGPAREACRARAALASEQAAGLRALINSDQPLRDVESFD
jgi:hypothetical protein